MKYKAIRTKDVLGIERYKIEGTYSTILIEDEKASLKISKIKRRNETGRASSWGSAVTITGFSTLDEALGFYSDRVLADDKKGE
jgi:hypothetical protein